MRPLAKYSATRHPRRLPFVGLVISLCLAAACGDDAQPATDAGIVAPTPEASLAQDASATETDGASGGESSSAATSEDGSRDDARQDDASISEADPYPAIMAAYRTWRALAEQPYDISAEIFGLCRLPTSAETEFAASVHARYALLDWANPVAQPTIDAASPTKFAEGAVIVKEKYAARDGGASAVAALGIMRKRGAGFDPAHGDWEFAYWTESEGLHEDATGACGSCHDSAAAVDYVFIDDRWRRGDSGR